MRPLLLEDGDEDKIQFVQKGSFGFERFFRAGGLDYEADDEISDS